jgi:rhodanese-related sulfurtransferase
MNFITAIELKSKIDNNDDFQLIDVREEYEFEDNNIGGINIPLEKMLVSFEQIDKEKQVVICCKSGKRSAAIILTLERKMKINNLYSLEGGVFGYLEISA